MNSTDFLKRVPLFTKMSDDDLVRLSRIVQERHFPKGNILFLENEPGHTLFIIKSGLIKISRVAPDGKAKTLTILHALEFFGEMAILDDQYRSATAEALADASVLTIYKKDFEALIKKYPHLALEVIHTLCQRLREANHQIDDLAFQDSRGKIANVLLRLAKEFGHSIDNNVSITIKISLTHQELSEMAGLSRETTTRMLNKLEVENIIALDKNHILIKDLSSLKKSGLYPSKARLDKEI